MCVCVCVCVRACVRVCVCVCVCVCMCVICSFIYIIQLSCSNVQYFTIRQQEYIPTIQEDIEGSDHAGRGSIQLQHTAGHNLEHLQIV